MIGIDLDGVVYDWHTHAYEYLRNYHSLDMSFIDFWSGGHRQVGNKLFWENLIRLEDLYYKYKPSTELVEMLQRLEEKFGYLFVTKRPIEVDFVTRKWLRNFDIPNSETVVFTSDKSIPCRAYGFTVFFEDNLEYAKELDEFTRVILVKQVWNKAGWDKYETINNILEAEEMI